MKKGIKYLLLIAVLGFLGYHSVYIKKLSEVTTAVDNKFDAPAFALKLWQEKLPARMDSAVSLEILIQSIASDKEAALNIHSNALAIGNYRYALVKTLATVTKVGADEVAINVKAGAETIPMLLATEFIYGNAIRDASGLIDIRDFPNTDELNRLSEALNEKVRQTVLPPFKSAVKTGDSLRVTAAIEVNKEHVKWSGLELLPVSVQIIH